MSLKPALNRWDEPQPRQGEIWLDADGQHTLIMDIYEDDGEMFAHVLCLNDGEYWTHEPFNSWSEPYDDGIPYYRILVG